MARGDTIEFENNIPTEHHSKYPEEEIEIKAILERMLHK